MSVKVDFHIHSCLSPCGSLEMSPRRIFECAKKAGLNYIAITDHNNAIQSIEASSLKEEYTDINLFYGLEIQTEEEIHILTLFDDIEIIKDWNKRIYELLLKLENNPDYYGDQICVDKNENIIYVEPYLLINSIEMSFDEAVREVDKLGGLAIPSHINASSFSIFSQLGFMPPDLPIFYAEIIDSKTDSESEAKNICKNYPEIIFVSFSDSHYPDQIGKKYTIINEDHLSINKLKEIAQKEKKESIIRFK